MWVNVTAQRDFATSLREMFLKRVSKGAIHLSELAGRTIAGPVS